MAGKSIKKIKKTTSLDTGAISYQNLADLGKVINVEKLDQIFIQKRRLNFENDTKR
jgi:hypothetical protein